MKDIIIMLNNNNTNMRELSFWGAYFPVDEIKDFTQALKNNKSLLMLKFKFTELKEHEVVLLAESLYTNKFLRQLHIDEDRCLNNAGAIALCDALKNNDRLTTLVIKPARIYPEGLYSLLNYPTQVYLSVADHYHDLLISQSNRNLEHINYFDFISNNLTNTNIKRNEITFCLQQNRRRNLHIKKWALILFANNLDDYSLFSYLPREILFIIHQNMTADKLEAPYNCTLF